jgi:hypothetical protein
MYPWDRRRFLQSSAALGSSLLAAGIGRTAKAKPALGDVPVVDQVVVREITDNQHNIFLKPLKVPGLTVARTGFPAAPQGKTLESEWGLAPASDDYLQAVMTELKKFDLDHVMPMHCSGQNFVDLAAKEMPEKLVLCGTGSSFTFTA